MSGVCSKDVLAYGSILSGVSGWIYCKISTFCERSLSTGSNPLAFPACRQCIDFTLFCAECLLPHVERAAP